MLSPVKRIQTSKHSPTVRSATKIAHYCTAVLQGVRGTVEGSGVSSPPYLFFFGGSTVCQALQQFVHHYRTRHAGSGSGFVLTLEHVQVASTHPGWGHRFWAPFRGGISCEFRIVRAYVSCMCMPHPPFMRDPDCSATKQVRAGGIISLTLKVKPDKNRNASTWLLPRLVHWLQGARIRSAHWQDELRRRRATVGPGPRYWRR